jgi:outer membrane receptor protein involved in Fe transport
MYARVSALLLALLVAFPVMGGAQETTGTINGRILDAQGLAIPGATVTLTGPQGARTFVTDADGNFSAPFLTPGTYTVRGELQGFKAAEARNVNVSLGQTTAVNMKMEVGGLTETVEVTGAASVVDTRSTTTGAVINSDMLQRVPVGRKVSDTLYLAPGVSSSGSAGRANPSISGGSGLDNQYVVDGVNITNTGYGALGSYSIIFGSLGNATPFDFIKEVQVKTGGYEAEFGQATGGVMNVVTKSGSNNFRGSLFGYTRPKALEGEWKRFESTNGTVQTTATDTSDGGAEGGGPIFRDKLFFFGAINPSWETRTLLAPEGFPLRADGEIDRKRKNLSYSTKLTWQAANAHRVDASFFGDPSKGEPGPQRVSSLERQTRSAFSELDYGGHNQTVRYDGVFGSNWLVEGSFARAKNIIEETPIDNTRSVTDRRVVPNVLTGGIGTYEAGNDSRNNQFKVASTNVFGGHQVKYGFQFEDVRFSQINQRTGPTYTAHDGRQTATGAVVDIIPDVNFGTIYRVIRANFNTDRTTTQKYYNFFVQDSWKITDRLTVNPGIRYEQQKLAGTLVDDFSLKNNWAPRIGVVYDVLGNGRSKLYGNFGMFYARVPNDLAARALSADDGVSREDFFDLGLTQPIPNGVPTQTSAAAGVITNHFALAGVGADVIDPNAKLSWKHETIVGFEWEAVTNINLGIRYIHRGIGNVLEDVAAFPMVGYDLGLPGAESVEYILTNPKADTPVGAPELGAHFEDPIHNYNAIELTMDRRFADNWSLLASYRFSRLRGTFEGFYREDNGQSDPGITSLYDFPTDDPSYTAIGTPQFGYPGDIRFLGKLGEGPLPLDRPHQFKVSGNYQFPFGLSLGTVFTTGSGKPLTPLAANPNYGNGGEIPTAPRGSGIETIDGFRKRTPWESQVDLQAAYSLGLGGAKRLTLLADAFNLFNLRRTIDYDAWTDLIFETPNPDFGQPVSQLVAGQMFQAPFALRLGARFEF